jgi:hypothetical protein
MAFPWAAGGSAEHVRTPGGKNEATRMAGAKQELRRALIDKKRAERASVAGHFEAATLLARLVAARAPGSVVETQALGKAALRLVHRLARVLGFAVEERGGGNRRVAVLTRGDGPPATEAAVEEAGATAAAFDDTASGAAAAAVLAGQRETAHCIRDRKAREVACGAPILRKIRQVYAPEEEEEEEVSEAHGDVLHNQMEGGGCGARVRTVAVLARPVAFVRSSGGAGGGDAAEAESAVAGQDAEEGGSSSGEEGEEEEGSGEGGAPPPPEEPRHGGAPPPSAPPVLPPLWEGTSRGIGSALLSRWAAKGDGGVRGSEALGADVEVKKDKRGLGL